MKRKKSKKSPLKKSGKPAARAKAKRPTRPAAPSKTFVGHKHFQDVLIRKRADILEMVKHKEGEISSGDIGDEADVASQTFEKEMMFEMSNGERIVLDDIEAALRKIEKGEFGFCESCRKKITSQRLKAMPWARYCIECQTRTEAPGAN